jgi:predicted GNAT family acetyltransferase
VTAGTDDQIPDDQIPDGQIPDGQIPDGAFTVADDPDGQRYELRVNGELGAFVTYKLSPGRIVFIHTKTLDAFSGNGIAARLVGAALDDARARGLQVVPRCPYVAHFISEHPEYEDLVR